MLNSTFQAFVV